MLDEAVGAWRRAQRYCSGSLLMILPCRPAFGAFGFFFGFVTIMLIQRLLSRRRRRRSAY